MPNTYKTWIYLMSGTNEDIVAGQKDIGRKVDSLLESINQPPIKTAPFTLPSLLQSKEEILREQDQEIKKFINDIAELDQKIAQKQQEFEKLSDNKKRLFVTSKLHELMEHRKRLSKKLDEAQREFNKIVKKKTLEDDSRILIMDAYKPDPVFLEKGVRVDMLQGVGASNLSPMQMNSQGQISKIKLPTAIIGTVTGWGEKQNIEHCMRQLAEAEAAGALPERIVLSGYSRGAVACLTLANAIFMQYGEKIKIAINIHDPVPGPGRQTQMVIPTNVDSLVITYAKHENNPVLKPLDLNHLYFDPSKTTVTTTGFDDVHNFSENLYDTMAALKNINTKMLSALDNQTTGLIYIAGNLNAQNDTFSSNRKKCIFHLASDPDLNKNLSPELKTFHQKLGEEVNHKDKSLVRGNQRNMVARATKCIVEDDRFPEKNKRIRKLKLKVIRQMSKRAIVMDQKKQMNAYLEWHKNSEIDPRILRNELINSANQLKNQINNIMLNKKNGQLSHHDTRRVDIIDYVSRSLTMLANDLEGKNSEEINYAEIYQILDNLKYFIQTQQPNLSGRIEAGINRGLRFFHMPMIKSEPYTAVMECLNSVLMPRQSVTYSPR